MTVVRADVVLFDLDGTLVESGLGITRGVASALDAVGAPPLDDATLLRFIGPPLIDSFRGLARLDDAMARAAIDCYHTYFDRAGRFECRVYDGIPELLRALVDDGRPVAVATSKRKPDALAIIEHCGLLGFLDAVCGPSPGDLHATKAESITEALAALRVSPGRDVVLVGDRSQDVVGAHDVGIECVGVAWGYGSRDELTAAGADAIVADVDELARLLGVTLSVQAGGSAIPSVGDEALA